MMVSKTLLLAIMSQSALVVGCSSSDFASGNEKASSPTAAAVPATAPASGSAAGAADASGTSGSPTVASAATAGTAAVAAAVPADCGADGATQATLLTKTVANNQAGNYLEYKLSVTDCSGKQIPFTAATVSFDIGANIGSEEDLTYTITDASNSADTISGTLKDLQGHDLFGNTGINYYHYETDKAVNFAAATNAIIFHVNLAGLSMVPYGTTSATTMNTYLAFGSAATVQTPVTLTGSPAAATTATLSSILSNL